MTGKIFLKLIAGVLGLLLIALGAVDYFATDVAEKSYKQNLVDQVAGKCRMLALSLGLLPRGNGSKIPYAPVGSSPSMASSLR